MSEPVPTQFDSSVRGSHFRQQMINSEKLMALSSDNIRRHHLLFVLNSERLTLSGKTVGAKKMKLHVLERERERIFCFSSNVGQGKFCCVLLLFIDLFFKKN